VFEAFAPKNKTGNSRIAFSLWLLKPFPTSLLILLINDFTLKIVFLVTLEVL
jgi:hypothetical protein